MKQSEIKELSVEELQEKLEINKKKYTDLKLAHAISPLESPLQLRNLRKTVARIATELNNGWSQQDNQLPFLLRFFLFFLFYFFTFILLLFFL